MKLRDSQRDALAAGTMDNMRRQRLLELQQRGFDVEQDPADGAFVVRDAAGGFARVESLGLRARVTSAEGRVTETEQYPGGRIRRIVDPSGREVRFERDAEGFLQSIDRGPEGDLSLRIVARLAAASYRLSGWNQLADSILAGWSANPGYSS